jgi:hypothetical protein
MKKHDVSYHGHNDSISFYSDHCIHLEAPERPFLSRSTKKEVSFPKRNFSDQSDTRIDLIENKEIKVFLEKTNNSKTILKRSISNESDERLNERSKRLIERRMNES